MLCAHGLEQLDTGDTGSTRTVQNDFDVFYLFPRKVQRIDQTGGTNNGGAVLIVVEDWDIHLFLEPLFDDETLGCLDVLKVDPPKGRTHEANGTAEFVRIFGIEFEVDRIDVGKAFEKNGLAFHHRFGAKRAQIPQTQDRGTIRDDSDQIALVGVVINRLGRFSDGFAWHRDPWRICEAQIPLRHHGDGRLNLPFAGGWFHMER